MPDLYDIVVTLMNDSRKTPELKAELREKYTFWSDGEAIFSKDESAIEALASFFERLGADSVDIVTGYYHPEEDDLDERTGYYYLYKE